MGTAWCILQGLCLTVSVSVLSVLQILQLHSALVRTRELLESAELTSKSFREAFEQAGTVVGTNQELTWAVSTLQLCWQLYGWVWYDRHILLSMIGGYTISSVPRIHWRYFQTISVANGVNCSKSWWIVVDHFRSKHQAWPCTICSIELKREHCHFIVMYPRGEHFSLIKQSSVPELDLYGPWWQNTRHHPSVSKSTNSFPRNSGAPCSAGEACGEAELVADKALQMLTFTAIIPAYYEASNGPITCHELMMRSCACLGEGSWGRSLRVCVRNVSSWGVCILPEVIKSIPEVIKSIPATLFNVIFEGGPLFWRSGLNYWILTELFLAVAFELNSASIRFI